MSDHCLSSSLPSTDRPIRVLKFGGTSVGTPERLQDTVHVVRETARSCRPVVVVSAAAGVTDLLVEAADAAPHSSAAAATWRERIGARYRALAEDTIGSGTNRPSRLDCRRWSKRLGIPFRGAQPPETQFWPSGSA